MTFIRELETSTIILKLNQAEKESREDVQAIFRSSLKVFLEQCLNKEAEFILCDEDGGHRSEIRMQAKYIPVPIELEMRETSESKSSCHADTSSAEIDDS